MHTWTIMDQGAFFLFFFQEGFLFGERKLKKEEKKRNRNKKKRKVGIVEQGERTKRTLRKARLISFFSFFLSIHTRYTAP